MRFSILYIIMVLISALTSCNSEKKEADESTDLIYISENLNIQNNQIINDCNTILNTYDPLIAGAKARKDDSLIIKTIKENQSFSIDTYTKTLQLDSLLSQYVYSVENDLTNKEVIQEIYKHRNLLCKAISNKTFDLSTLYLDNDEDTAHFYDKLNAATKDLDQEEAHVIKEICQLLSFPLQISRNNTKIDWVEANFKNSEEVYNKMNLESIRTKIWMAEYLALKEYLKYVENKKLDFNTIELLVNSSNAILKKNEPLKLNLKIIAYDSLEIVKIKYWIDDKNKLGTPIEYEGNNWCFVPVINQSIGKHIIYGDYYFMKNKSIPWEYEYYIVE
jgi:hypothetical protein